jgi:hypothetical protein
MENTQQTQADLGNDFFTSFWFGEDGKDGKNIFTS